MTDRRKALPPPPPPPPPPRPAPPGGGGAFQQVIARKERKETLRDVLGMLKSSRNPQVEYLARVMKKWGRENNVSV